MSNDTKKPEAPEPVLIMPERMAFHADEKNITWQGPYSDARTTHEYIRADLHAAIVAERDEALGLLEPECGKNFCDSCGDCLHCYGGERGVNECESGHSSTTMRHSAGHEYVSRRLIAVESERDAARKEAEELRALAKQGARVVHEQDAWKAAVAQILGRQPGNWPALEAFRDACRKLGVI